MDRLARRSLALVPLLALSIGAGTADAALSAHGSARQVYATGLGSGARATLLDASGHRVARRRATALGGVLFRDVDPGKGYRVASGGSRSGPLTVFTNRSKPPRTGFYGQRLPTKGYGYMRTRDGTKLAYYVHPPQGEDPSDSKPAPTLIEYSGYGYANPAGPNSGISPIANLMGFAVVDVNMRGTGCSSGAFDFFEPLQSLDGYDVIETVARQPWVKFHRVGMMGISYGGISQLFTAQTRPPSLAAIAPMSVIDSTQTTLYPGGILNTGFALVWGRERMHDARPASKNGGQEWAYQRIQDGDKTCKANQALHGEAVNVERKIRRNDHYRPEVADPLAPVTFVHRIEVPTFLACQWEDEQTGGHCPTLAEHFTGTKRRWFTFTNGTHVDSLDPATANRWFDFLKLYVARENPAADAPFLHAVAPAIYQSAMGISGVTLPPDPIQEQPTYAGAKAMFDRQKPVRILFDNGARWGEPGKPFPAYERSFARFPVPSTTERTWYLRSNGRLRSSKPRASGADAFAWRPGARPPTDFTGSTSTGDNGLWTATPKYRWFPPPPGTGVSYLTRKLIRDRTVIGAGAVHLWIKSSKPNVDLQATITEVRPDGKETFVQSGWLRADEPKLDKGRSTPLEPWLSLRERDVRPLPPDRFVKVTIPLYYQGHAYRAGSRIRVLITAPGGDQPVWQFAEAQPKGGANVAIAHSRKRPSRLTLPVAAGVITPTGLPACPSLRAEPCRDFKPFVNRAAGP